MTSRCQIAFIAASVLFGGLQPLQRNEGFTAELGEPDQERAAEQEQCEAVIIGERQRTELERRRQEGPPDDWNGKNRRTGAGRNAREQARQENGRKEGCKIEGHSQAIQQHAQGCGSKQHG